MKTKTELTAEKATQSIRRHIVRSAWIHSTICGLWTGLHFDSLWVGYVSFLGSYLAVELVDTLVAAGVTYIGVTLRHAG